MKSTLSLTLLIILTSFFCNGCNSASNSTDGNESVTKDTVAVEELSNDSIPPRQYQDETITIATFNIQIFGRTKISKPEIVQRLVELVRKYDIVAIQEFKDASGETPIKFLEEVNEGNSVQYAFRLSPRTGLQDDDRSSMEQYGYYYNTETIEYLNSEMLYDDSQSDLFQREPFLAQFKAKNGNFTFVLSNIHTRPESAVEEIGALHNVIEWAKVQFPDEEDFITLGDFNAGCNYASPEELNNLEFRGREYVWIVPDSADTNFSTNTECAYDRIVLTTGGEEDFTGEWGIDYSIDDTDISDHFPVWARFKIINDD